MIETINFEKLNGLVPVVVQDAESLQVAMVGFMNEDALRETLSSKKVTFWSRSKSKLWQKGESSGHYLEVLSIETDCDHDALLIKVKTHGPVCHTGKHTCFGDQYQTILPSTILEQLEGILEQRKTASPNHSYTAKLYSEGTSKIAQKLGEEAIETILAAIENNKKHLAEEAADLLYHLLVLLHNQGMSLHDVCSELKQRMK
ncbi:MAG: bifunctional phosphoribosyl-AMP cyclohydrolase/phosphoribosyl-ATP diphosphatase HisIE [Bacteroidetes bacterium]|nr:bifunctional phosphoribosyl-AMP cyclohydrolase/phosphoribosyl-ATP diphosphatase HisIE [Bacteroidota bacterium]